MRGVSAPPVILHADMDAFYASVEQHDRPELRGRPVIVGGLGGRGVVTAASYEARPYGVHSAMSTAEARRLCPHAIFLPGRMARYVEVSRRIRRVFDELTPLVEPLSLDEAFLDITASLRLLGTPTDAARRLKRRVREETGLAVSVGIGPTLMVAKIASARAKPDGLLEVPPGEVEAFLHPLPVRALWGIGPVAGAKLGALGIVTIGDLAHCPPARLEHVLGSGATALRALARGRDPRRVVAGAARKSCGEESTFATDIGDGPHLRQTIIAHAEAVARRLRAERRLARTVVLKLKHARRTAPGTYPVHTRSRTLPTATDDGRVLAAAALELWRGDCRGVVVRLIGVSATNLVATGASAQLDLFSGADRNRQAALNRALDRIAARFGEGVLTRGGTTVERAAPTTSWKDRTVR
jgi:DNA polymerase-4